ESGHVLLVGETIAWLVATVVARCGPIAAEIHTGAEAPPGARQDDRARRAVCRDPTQLDVQRLAQLRGHRVQLVGPVQRELADLARRFLDEQRWGHCRHPMSWRA